MKHIVLIVAAACVACGRAPSVRPLATYDPETGRLQRLETDTNGNGRNDTTTYMDGARIRRIELDLDENGAVERWDFYDDAGTLEKVGLSRQNDGVMDAVAFYDEAGALLRLEVSTARDGRFERVEHYRNGVLVRSQEDTDGDGRPDKWDSYAPSSHDGPAPAYTVTMTELDESGRGRPDKRFVFAADGSIARVESDPDGDGIFSPVIKP